MFPLFEKNKRDFLSRKKARKGFTQPRRSEIYRFDLKIHGSDRLDSRPTLPRGRALRGSFGLPGANQNRARILSRQKPENSNKISIRHLERGDRQTHKKRSGLLWLYCLILLPVLTGCFWNQKQKSIPGHIDMDKITAGNSSFLVNKLEGAGHLNYEQGVPHTFTLLFQTCVKGAVKQDSSVPLNTQFVVAYETAEKNSKGSYKKITKEHEVSANEGGCIHWSEEYPYRYAIKSRWIGLKRIIKGGEGSFYHGKVPVGTAVNPWIFESAGVEIPGIIDLRPLYYDKTVDILERYEYDENGLAFLTSKTPEYPQLWAPNITVQISLSEDQTDKDLDLNAVQNLKEKKESELAKKERELAEFLGKAFSASKEERKLNEKLAKIKKNEIKKLNEELAKIKKNEFNELEDLIKNYTVFCSLNEEASEDCYTRKLQMVLTIPLELRTLGVSGEIQKTPVTGGSYNIKAYLTAKQRGKGHHYQLHTEKLHKSDVRQGHRGESSHQSAESLIVDFSASILFIDFNATYKLVLEVESVDQPFKKFQGVYTLEEKINIGPRQKGVEIDNWLVSEYESLFGSDDFQTKEINVISSMGIQPLFGQENETQAETIKRLKSNEFHSTHLEVQVNDSSIKFSNVKTGNICRENENVIERTIEYKATACFKDFFIEKPEGIPFRIIVENPNPKQGKQGLKQLFKITDGVPEFYETNTDGCIEWTDELYHKNYNRQIYIERKIHFISKNELYYGQVRIGLNPWQGAFQFGRNLSTASEDKIRTERTGVRDPRLVINQTRSVNFFPSYLIDKFLNISIAHNFYFLFQVIISRHDDIAEGRHPRGREFIRDGYHLIRLLIMRSPVEVGIVQKVKSTEEHHDRLSNSINDGVEAPFIGGKYLSHVDTVIDVKGNWVNIYVPTQFNHRQFVYLASRNQMSVEIYPADPREFKYKEEKVAEGEACELDFEKTKWKPYFHCRDLGLKPHESGDCHELVTVPYTSPFQTNEWVNWHPVRPARFKLSKTKPEHYKQLPVRLSEDEKHWILDRERVDKKQLPLRWSESEEHWMLNTDEIINQSEAGRKRKHFTFDPRAYREDNKTASAQNIAGGDKPISVISSRSPDCPVDEGFTVPTVSEEGKISSKAVPSENTGAFVTADGVSVQDCFGDDEAILAGGKRGDFPSPEESAGKTVQKQSTEIPDTLRSFADGNSLKIVDLSNKDTAEKFIADLNETGKFFRKQSAEIGRLLSENPDSQQPRVEEGDPSSPAEGADEEKTDLLSSAVVRLFGVVGEDTAEEIKNKIETQCTTEEEIGVWSKVVEESAAAEDTTWTEAARTTWSSLKNFSVSDFFMRKATAPFAEYFNKCSLNVIWDEFGVFLERHAENFPLSDTFRERLKENLERNSISGIYRPSQKNYSDFLIKMAYLTVIETSRERLKSIVNEGITAENYTTPVNGSFIHNLCSFWFEKYFSDYLESEQMVSAYTSFIKKTNYNEILENRNINYDNFDLDGLFRLLGDDDSDSPGKCVEDYRNCLLSSSCDASSRKCESNVDSCMVFLEDHCQKDDSDPLCRDKESFSEEYLCQGKMKLYCEQNPFHRICDLYGNSRCRINRETCVNGLTGWFDGIRTNPIFDNFTEQSIISSNPLKTCLANPFEFFRFERKMAVLELDTNSFRYLNGAPFNFSVSSSHSINSAVRWSGQSSGSFSIGPSLNLGTRKTRGKAPIEKKQIGLKAIDIGGQLTADLKTGISTSISNNGGRDISIRAVDGVYLSVHRAAIEMGVRKFQKCLVVKPRPNAFFSRLTDDGLKQSYEEDAVWSKELMGNDMKKIAVARPGLLICNPSEERPEGNPEKIVEHYYYVFQELSRNMEFLFMYDEANRPYTMIFRGQNEFFKYFSLLRELREGRTSEGGLHQSQNEIPVNLFADYAYPIEEVIGLNYSIRALNETGFHQGIYSYPDREYLNVEFFRKNSGIVGEGFKQLREITTLPPPYPDGGKAPVQFWGEK